MRFVYCSSNHIHTTHAERVCCARDWQCVIESDTELLDARARICAASASIGFVGGFGACVLHTLILNGAFRFALLTAATAATTSITHNRSVTEIRFILPELKNKTNESTAESNDGPHRQTISIEIKIK